MSTEKIYRNKLIRLQLQYPKKVWPLFATAATKMAALSINPNSKFLKSYSFSRITPLNKRIAEITLELYGKLLDSVTGEIKYAWNLSIEKNDLTLKDVPIIPMNEALLSRNLSSLATFINRGHGSETLSARVWNVAEQSRAEMELALADGIKSGRGAKVISQQIRQHLKNPDALFRRVRDAKGKLMPSKFMAAYHPGRGVYKSAYKNAVRIARTETNMAYLMADHVRWLTMDMVIGVRIALSDQHPEYKFLEICEVLEGDYPKEFIFVGWHVQCMCHATPIMSNEADFRQYLRGETDTINAKPISKFPEKFVNFINSNAGHIAGLKSTPYWFRDNKKIIMNVVADKNSALKKVVANSLLRPIITATKRN